MALKEWNHTFEGHSIKVKNTWLGGAELHIDGKCRSTNKDFFALTQPTKALLSAPIEENNPQSPLVEVFFRALLTVKARICINGQTVGGDLA